MNSCPIKTRPEWEILVNRFGIDNTWKVWLLNEDYLSINEAEFQLYAVANPKQAGELLDKYMSDEARSKVNPKSTVKELLDGVDIKIYTEIPKDFLKSQRTQERLDPFTTVTTNPVLEVDSIFNLHNQSVANNVFMNLSNLLSKKLGREIESISSRDATELLKHTRTPYNNQPSFVNNGRLYIVYDRTSLNNVLHEFSSPFINIIQTKNKKLFDNLYTELENSPEAEEIFNKVKMNYPTLANDPDMFKEKAVAYALEHHSLNQITSQGFRKFIDKVLYQIKQLLRTIVGKIRVENLNTNTSLRDLADMLINDDTFILDTREITEEEMEQAKSEDTKYVNEMMNKIDRAKLMSGIDIIINQLSAVGLKTKEALKHYTFKDIEKALSDEERKGGIIDKLIKGVISMRTENVSFEREQAARRIPLEERAAAALNSLASIKVAVEYMNNAMDQLANITDEVEKLNKVQYYNTILRSWDSFIDDTLFHFNNMGLDNNTDVYKFVNSIKGDIKVGFDKYKEIQKSGVIDFTFVIMQDLMANAAVEYDKQIQDTKDKIAKASSEGLKKEGERKLKQLEDERKKFILDRETVAKAFSGEWKDANYWSSMFVSYTSNPDPIIATFAYFVKNNIGKIEARAYTTKQKFDNQIADSLRKLGIKSSGLTAGKQKDIWKEYLFTDTKLVRDGDNFVPQQVLSFLNPIQNADTIVPGLEKKVEDLREKFNEIKRVKQDEKDPEVEAAGKELKAAIEEYENHLQKYFNREYDSRVYEANKVLYQTVEGLEAYDARREVLDEISQLNMNSYNEVKEYENFEEYKALWAKYNNLYSEYNLDGTHKDEKGKRIAKTLQAHRERTKEFYEWKEIKGAFNAALAEFESTYKNLHPEADEAQVENAVQDWITKNTMVRYSEDYRKQLSDLYDEIKQINDSLPQKVKDNLKDPTTGETLDQLYSRMREIMVRTKDEFNMYDGNLLDTTQRRELKRIQESINTIQENYSKETGLSLEDYSRFLTLDALNDTQELTSAEKAEYDDLKKIMNDPTGTMNMADRLALSKIFNDLSNLQNTQPTDAYLEKINFFLERNNETKRDASNIWELLYPKTDIESGDVFHQIDAILAKDKEFEQWFKANHIYKAYVSRNTGEIKYAYQKLPVWSTKIPNVTNAYLKSTYKRNGKEYTIARVPNIAYMYRTVKNEYRTIPYGLTAEEREQYIGGMGDDAKAVIDNKGNWLPKNLSQNAPLKDNPYINQTYYNLQNTNRDKFNLLKLITKYHLTNQKGVAYRDRLYLEYPRFSMTNEELIEQGLGKYVSEKKLKVTKTVQGLTALVTGKGKDAANAISQLPEDVDQETVNAEEDAVKEIKYGMLDMATSKSHVRGKANIPIERVSYDLLKVINEYMISCEKQRVLTEIDPIAQAFVNTLNDPDNLQKDLSKKVVRDSVDRTIRNYLTDPSSKNVRAAAVQALYNREFKNKIFSEGHMDALNKLTSMVMGLASTSYFALNIPSALRNYYGALWQLNIETVGGEYVNKSSLIQGKIWAKKAMADWTLNIYGGAPPTLNKQMIIYFDAVPGKARENFAREYARTFQRDVYSMSWLYSPRKFTEMEAGLQLFYAMMNKQTVKQTINGVTKEIPYSQAFELDKEGIMKLKDGIDKEWDISGKEFNRFKSKVHEVYIELNGAFDKFSQPQAAAYFAYRLASFMRRYFTSMFMKRFATKRANYAKGVVQTGYYVESVRAIGDMMRSMGKSIHFMTPQEKRAVYRTLVEFAQISLASFIMYAAFGWDPEDPDKFDKLKAKSGPLGSDDFRLSGFISNHALSLLMKVQNENESFIPLPKYGLNDYTKLADLGSIAFGPTLIAYAEIFTDIAAHAAPGEDETLFYKKDVGPYPWQEEGSAKIWNTLFKITGITGSDISPVKGLEGAWSVQNKFNG